MDINVSTDNTIHGDARVIEVAEQAVNNDLGHMSDWLTRVEVHLKDQNGDKKGPVDVEYFEGWTIKHETGQYRRDAQGRVVVDEDGRPIPEPPRTQRYEEYYRGYLIDQIVLLFIFSA